MYTHIFFIVIINKHFIDILNIKSKHFKLKLILFNKTFKTVSVGTPKKFILDKFPS